MSFAKFVSLLQTQALHFASTPSLRCKFDEYEGLAPDKILEKWRQHDCGDAVLSFYERNSFCYWVKCLIHQEYESHRMWKSYAPKGLATVTTFADLRDSFIDEQDVYLGLIEYFDYEKDNAFDELYEYYRGFEKLTNIDGLRWYDIVRNDFAPELVVDPFPSYPPILTKRKDFNYEHELRAIIVPYSTPTLAEIADYKRLVTVALDLGKLIQTVVIAPTAPQWFFKTVSYELKTYGLHAEVIYSELDQQPKSD